MGNEQTQKLIQAYNEDKDHSVLFDFSLDVLLEEIKSSPISLNYYLKKLNRYCQYINLIKFKKNLN